MYEVNDSGREGELYGDGYFDSFVSFIESLGYDVQENQHVRSGIVIDGVEFAVKTDNASYCSKNAYTRKRDVRKPQNRFITLGWRSWDNTYVLKVFINKEMETEKLKQKINKAIEWKKNQWTENTNREQRNKDNTMTIGKHYIHNDAIREAVESVIIEKGTINFYFKDKFYLKLNADNTFMEASFNPIDMKSMDEVDALANSVLGRCEAFETIAKAIISAGTISQELIEWSTEMLHRYFYTETMSPKLD